jgi:hypothetical protein
MPRGQIVSFTPKHEKAGWMKHTSWHWQIRLPGGCLDYWPSRDKWMFRGEVRQSSFAEITAFIDAQPVAVESTDNAIPSNVVPIRTTKPPNRSALQPRVQTEPGWKAPCSWCGGGLFWRKRDNPIWTCDKCQPFKGRGLGINWLTTPAYSAMLDRLAERARQAP